MNTLSGKTYSEINTPLSSQSHRLFWVLIAEIALIYFFVPAGRFDFRPYGLGFSTGFNAYKLFPVIYLTWALWRWRTGATAVLKLPFVFPFATFVFFTLVASVASPQPYQAMTEFLEILFYFFFLLILLDIPWSSKSLMVVFGSFVVGNLYMGGVAVYEFAQAWQTESVPRIDATYDFPNALVVYCIFGFTLLMWAFYQTSSWRHQIILLVTVLVVLFCAVASISRGTAIAFVTIGLLFIVLGERKLKITGMSVLVILVVFSLFYTPQILQRFMDIFQEANQKNLASRFYIWPALLDLKTTNFSFFGVGMGPLIFNEMASANVASPNPHRLSEAWHAHSLYLQLFFATGVMGLFSFLWLFTEVIRRLLKHRNTPNIILLSGVIAFLAHQTIEIHLLVGNIPIAMITVIAIASKETSALEERS